MALGQQLRKARMDRKLTTSQVASATRMKVQMVDAIEREDFSTIAAPIYGKGFIKLFADQVGLDPTPLVNEYMMRFVNGEAPPAVSPVMMPEPIYGESEEDGEEEDSHVEITADTTETSDFEEDAVDLFSGIVDDHKEKDFGHKEEPSVDFSKFNDALKSAKDKIIKEGVEPCVELWHKGGAAIKKNTVAAIDAVRGYSPEFSSLQIKGVSIADTPAKMAAVVAGVLLVLIIIISSVNNCGRTPSSTTVDGGETLETAINPLPPYVD